ncbi:MAG TPA: UDP-glucose 4-epimerase GalE, partial [Chloroflexota bacterium]|nr:UDP-glucose 4-epimerase GalE [Chloroflexota bacterium]
GHSIPAEERARRAGDPAVLVASSARIRRDLDWQPRLPDVEQIIATAWDWHRAHPHGYAQ